MRIVFLATGEIALPTLDWLLRSRHDLAALVTQPDKPVGRSGSKTRPPRVKTVAQAAGMPVLQPRRCRKPQAVEQIAAFEPEVLLVMAYGQILPKSLLTVPRIAPINLHASLLPRHRGAAPVHAAILSGDSRSGITVMYVAEGLDTGDMLLKRELEIGPRETAGQLHDRIAQLTPDALSEALDLLEAGSAPRQPQADSLATYAPKLDRHMGRIDWNRPAEDLDRLIRGLHPWPGTWTTLPRGEKRVRLKLHCAEPLETESARENSPPGTVLSTGPEGITIACGGETTLCLGEAQPEGKTAMKANELANGSYLTPGIRLGG
jgi:methionyl-tRNA formyltransferase